MPQAVKSNLFLYADDSCLMYQHREVKEIEKQLNKDFKNVYTLERIKPNLFFLQVSVKSKVQKN